ncbi:MAG: peptidylprolyl isomerase A [Halobacteriovoraceae bacterium]|jgi:peptidyl-prolyl cis-trans isomerase A (cyclophilin A)|nr:peptidylprolyl isomerase A [Halobacteriovoraceae bacterium]
MKKILIFTILLTSLCSYAGTEIVIQTSMGTIEVELFDKTSKESVRNFLQYIDEDFYTNTLIHRVIKDYIIQGGGLDINFDEKKTHPQIKNEALNMTKNLKGTIAMARKRPKHSAKSEFYFNLKDNPNLDHRGLGNYGYAVFGKITKGFDVALKIGNVPIARKGLYKKVPNKPVIIKSITRK